MGNIQASLAVAREAIARHEASGPNVKPLPARRNVVLVVEDDDRVAKLIEENLALVAADLEIVRTASMLETATGLERIATSPDVRLVAAVVDVALPDGKADIASPMVCTICSMSIRRLIFTGGDASFPGFETIRKGDTDAWKRFRDWGRETSRLAAAGIQEARSARLATPWGASRLEVLAKARADGRLHTVRRMIGARPTHAALTEVVLCQSLEEFGPKVVVEGADVISIESAPKHRTIRFAKPWTGPINVSYDGLTRAALGSGRPPDSGVEGSWSFRATVNTEKLILQVDLSADPVPMKWSMPWAYSRPPGGSLTRVPMLAACRAWDWIEVGEKVGRLEIDEPVLGMAFVLEWKEVRGA